MSDYCLYNIRLKNYWDIEIDHPLSFTKNMSSVGQTKWDTKWYPAFIVVILEQCHILCTHYKQWILLPWLMQLYFHDIKILNMHDEK